MHSTSSGIPNQQSICQACGICCDGSLFESADIDASGPGGSWPIDVVQALSAGKKLPQPCPAFQKNLCVIYPDRPQVCQGFSCRLLNEYTAGAIDLEGALSVVQATKILKLAFAEAMTEATGVASGGSPQAVFNQFSSAFKEEFDTAQFKRKHSKVLLIYARLQHQLKTRFHHPEEESSPVCAATEGGGISSRG
jgi:Fe-S-cluster containining protein